jgi:cell division protein ZipA
VANLRWVLAVIGVLIVAGIYLVGRFGTKERKRDRVGHASFAGSGESPKSSNQTKRREEPEITISDTDQSTTQYSNSQAPTFQYQTQDDEIPAELSPDVSSVEHASFLEETLAFEMDQEDSKEKDEEVDTSALDEEDSSVSSTEHVSFLEETLAFEVEQEAFAEMDKAVEAVLGPDVEDDIVDVEIPPELSGLQEEEQFVAEPGLGSEVDLEKETIEKKEPQQHELVLDIEPLVLVLSVMASNDGMFAGNDIRTVLEEEKLEFGDMDVFNFYIEDKQNPIFSVASIVEPGVFNLETLDEYETPGIFLFSQLPGSIPGVEAFDILLNKSRNIAGKLGGQVCDDKRNRLTEQATTHYRDKIVAFEHDLMLARKKQQQ